MAMANIFFYFLAIFWNFIKNMFFIKNPLYVMKVDLPADILSEILYRCPSESVMRFKRVSKTWNFHISSAEFQEGYCNRNSEELRLVYIDSDYWNDQTTAYNFNLDTLKGLNYDDARQFHRLSLFRFVSCYRGLICLVSVGRVVNFVLWNPSSLIRNSPIGDSIVVSFPTGKYIDDGTINYRFGSPGCLIHGLCYSSFEYKVVMFVGTYGSEYFHYVVLNFSNGTHHLGRQEGIPISCVDEILQADGVVIDGKPHWASKSEALFFVFDDKTGEFSMMQVPQGEKYFTVIDGVGASNGNLVVASGMSTNTKIQIWMLEEYNDPLSWMKWMSIPNEGTIPMCEYRPVGQFGRRYVATNSNRIYVYNQEEDSLQIESMPEGLNEYVWIGCETTLVSPMKWRHEDAEELNIESLKSL